MLIRPGIESIKKIYTQHSEMSAPVALLTLGICGLLIEGMFLHVFEDSMVTYLFLVPLGIALGGEMKANYKAR